MITVPSTKSSEHRMEPSNPKVPPVYQIFFRKVKNQQILIAEFISTDFISQNRALNPVPEPMQSNGKTRGCAYIYRKPPENNLPAQYSETGQR